MNSICRYTPRRSLFLRRNNDINTLNKAIPIRPSVCSSRTRTSPSSSRRCRHSFGGALTTSTTATTKTQSTTSLTAVPRGNEIISSNGRHVGWSSGFLGWRRSLTLNGITIVQRHSSVYVYQDIRGVAVAACDSGNGLTMTLTSLSAKDGNYRWATNSPSTNYSGVKSRAAPRGFTSQAKGLPMTGKRNLHNNNYVGVCNPLDFTSRYYSDSSRDDAATSTSKKKPIIDDYDNRKPNNIQSMSSQITSQEIGTSSTQQPQQPSEPSIHNISYLPPTLRPYAHLARLDKPIGTFLLLHPCLWSTALATTTVPLDTHAYALPDLQLCALFGIGSFVMRGAGCTINDMWDSQYDKNVERTKSRPLASGDLSYPQAWKFLALQLSAGLGVLVSLPHLEQCFWWGAASLPLVATYPLAKRYTPYPQLALGATFNWGAVMGWVAVRGEVDWTVVGPLYAGCVAWTLVYDTLYAHQDKVDDAKLGLNSTALTFGEEGTKPILAALAVGAWGGWSLAGYNCGFGNPLEVPYYYAGVSAAGAHLMWQIWTAELDDAENLAERFRSNNTVGWIMFGSCVVGNVMAG